ncbi:MAG: GNAT family N-acetyltransferase [Desulfosarcinaceae bacterium]
MNRDKIPLSIVAFLDAKLVGTVSLKVREMTTHTLLPYWVGAVYVVEQFRNRGIGTELITRATDKARDLGVETLYLHTPDKAGLYSRLGWEEIERIVYYDHEVVIMKKEYEKLRNHYFARFGWLDFMCRNNGCRNGKFHLRHCTVYSSNWCSDIFYRHFLGVFFKIQLHFTNGNRDMLFGFCSFG